MTNATNGPRVKKASEITIGSTWTGRNVAGEVITLTVKSDPIPGNELRHMEYADGSRCVVGKNWFYRAYRTTTQRIEPNS